MARLAGRLPGLRLADLLAPQALAGRDPRPGRGPGPRDAREAAVLVLLAPSDAPGAGPDDVTVLLVERAGGPGAHAGQVAFPGGGVDAGDASPAAAALREAAEETGLDDGDVVVLGALPRLPVPVSGYVVTPVVAWQPVATAVRAGDPAEIAAVHRVPLAALADPAHRVRMGLPAPDAATPRWAGPGFVVGEVVVWGFTALLLDALLRLAGLERPWPQDPVVGVPARFTGSTGPRREQSL